MFGGDAPGWAYPGQGYAGTTSSTATGTADAPMGALGSSATSVRTGIGVAAAVLGALLASASGVRTVHGTAAAPLGALSASASSEHTVFGTAAAPLGGLTASATSLRTAHGIAAAPLGGLSSSATGLRTRHGTAAAPLGTVTGTATGVRTRHGTAAAPLGSVTATAASPLFAAAAGQAYSTWPYTLALNDAGGEGESAFVPRPFTGLLRLGEAAGQADSVFAGTIGGLTYAGFNAAAGIGASSWQPHGLLLLSLDDAPGSTHVFGGYLGSEFSLLTDAAGLGHSYFRGVLGLGGAVASLGDNVPLQLVAGLYGQLALYPPVTAGASHTRTVALTVLSPVIPAVSQGKPSSPAYWARLPAAATLIQGPRHIHAIADPNPIWNPATSGWFYPPPNAGVGTYRWHVGTLPDPASQPGGWYWLGDPTGIDGSAYVPAAGRQWAPDPGTGGPSWHSFFPFKPSVRAYDAYLPGGNVVHHPKGVHFNAHFIEHMWADMGTDRRQPFTWVIAGMVASYPGPGYQHFLLDAGRNPDSTGMGRISAEACNTPRPINDLLGYRSIIATTPDIMSVAASNYHADAVRLRMDAAIRPKMFFGIFNGAASYAGAYDPGGHRLAKGRIANTSAQHHRYYVLGRRQGWLSQQLASHIMIFEIRYFNHALSTADLASQYDQLSTTYSYGRYRAL